MSRIKTTNGVSRTDDASFDEFYGAVSQDWEGRARRLQARRWRKLKHQFL